METSAVQSVKLAIVSATGLSKDALHVYVGLALFFLVVLALRKPVRSWVPLVSVFVAAAIGELMDMRDDIATFGYWRWAASLHDVANTLFWPTVLVVLARRTRTFHSASPTEGRNIKGSPDARL